MHRQTLVVRIMATAMAAVVAGCEGESRFMASDVSAAGEAAGAGGGSAGHDARLAAPLSSVAPPAAASAAPAKRESSPASEPSGVVLPAQAQRGGAMLVRSGHATLEVDSMEVGVSRVRRLAQETGALVANTTVQGGREQRRTASLELRVPADRFDAIVDGLASIGKVEAVNITAQDVGEEFVDLAARLANARRLETRLIELLANRAGRLSDVLTVERELARVREQIERYEGRLRYLQSRVAISSLTVVVHEPAPVVARHPGENVIADAFVEAWRRFVRITAGFIAALGVLVPLGALGAAAFVLGRRYLPRLG
jgi:hypothetical protein